jgi:transposase
LALPDPWERDVRAALALIDDLDGRITACERELRELGADHRYVALLETVPGIAWVLGYTIASEIGDITRFSSPTKLCGYTGLCPRVYQSGERDRRGPLAKNGPRYLRWALVEAAGHAARHPLYKPAYEHTKQRLGRQRGPKVARVVVARKLTEAIWHMLTRSQPFAPAGAPRVMAA